MSCYFVLLRDWKPKVKIVVGVMSLLLVFFTLQMPIEARVYDIQASDGEFYAVTIGEDPGVLNFDVRRAHGGGEILTGVTEAERNTAVELYFASNLLRIVRTYYSPDTPVENWEQITRDIVINALHKLTLVQMAEIFAGGAINALPTGDFSFATAIIGVLPSAINTGRRLEPERQLIETAGRMAIACGRLVSKHEKVLRDFWWDYETPNYETQVASIPIERINAAWESFYKIMKYQLLASELIHNHLQTTGLKERLKNQLFGTAANQNLLTTIGVGDPFITVPIISTVGSAIISTITTNEVLDAIETRIQKLKDLAAKTDSEIHGRALSDINKNKAQSRIALEQAGFFQPTMVRKLDDMQLLVGDSPQRLDVQNYFSPRGSNLTYIGRSSNLNVAIAHAERSGSSVIIINPKSVGTTSVKVELMNFRGLSVTQSFTVTVGQRAQRNQQPVGMNTIPDQTLRVSDSPKIVNVSNYFQDPDGDALTYAVWPKDRDVVSTRRNGAIITITPKRVGSTEMIVRATDPGGLEVLQRFVVHVIDPASTDFPDLSVQSISASTASVAPGERFLLDTVVQNQGDAASQPTTLRFYRSSDPDISPNDTQLHEQTVRRINVGQQITPWKQFTAPDVPGVYYYGVCVDRSGEEPAIDNNCSKAIKITVLQPTLPDLIVESISVSKATLVPGERFTLSVTVRNIGTARSQFGVLRYYEQFNEADKRNIRRLSPNQTSNMSIQLEAPQEPGVYYYDASISKVRDEVNTDNNDSNRVAITVGAPAAVNQAPIASGTIPTRELTVGGSSTVMDVSRNFRDPDNDGLTYTVRSDNVRVVMVSVSGAQVILNPQGVGVATVTVTASDGVLTAVQRFSVSVRAAPVANRPPVNVSRILDQTLAANGAVVRLDLSTYFSDADGDTLTYTITSDNPNVAFLQVVGASVSILPLSTVGRANVRVTASDGDLTAIQDFIVIVQRTQPVNQPPVAIGTIAPQTLTVDGAARGGNISSYFRDPDGNTLTYTARSDDTNVVRASMSSADLTLTPVRAGSTTVTVTASDGSLTATQRFTVQVQSKPSTQPVNQPPVAIGTIAPQTLTVDGAARGGNISSYFRDPDGNTLTYTARSDDTNVVRASMSSADLTLTPVRAGSTTVTVTASDGSLTATQRFTVQVQSKPSTQPVNQPPVAIGTIAPQTLTVDGAARGGNISSYFRDPDGNTLTYTARSDDTNVVRASMSSADLTLTPVRAGSTTVTVTASDGSLTATQRFTVQVQSKPSTQPVNQAPAAIETISPQTFTVNGAVWRVNVANYFNDADGDSLTYTARPADANVATTQVSGDFLTITPLRAGSTTITVTASDGSLTATHRFTVTVQSATFRVGDAVIVQNSKGGGLNGLLVRNGAGTGFAHTISVFNGATGTITDGPRRANGYTWWKVNWDRSDQVFCDVNPCVGWVFELFQGTRVLAKNSAPPVEIKSPPDLVIQSVRVSDDTLTPNESFTFYATVRNQGAGEASRTTLRYYRSSDATISTTDTSVDTDSVTSLDPNESTEESDSLRAPREPGIYYYGVCVDSVTDESNTNNNCSRGIRIRVGASSPDLVTESVRVSDDTVEVGERFTFYATVRNQGNGDARRTTLRYYRSSDSSISERDTEEDTDSVSSLDAGETSEERVTITAPNQSGTYYYGVCVDDVTDESNTNNNCSTGIRVTVADAIIVRPPPAGLRVGDSVVVQNASGGGLNGLIVRSGAGTGFAHIISVFNGATGAITDGPENANGYTWWKVDWDRSDQVFCDVNPCVGWVIEFFQGTRVLAEDGLAAPTFNVMIPTETALLSNYPNPFNPETWIPYQLVEPADVRISIYAVDGKLVRTLALGHQQAGVYQNKSRAAYWDGRNAFGERVASGLYFYMFTAGDFTATRKMLIRK